MDEKIKEQILYIRVSGLTNMFDVTMVQRLANEYGFYELVIFLEENRADYVHFILYGEESNTQLSTEIIVTFMPVINLLLCAFRAIYSVPKGKENT